MARKRNSYPEYRYSPQMSNNALYERKAVELPEWCNCDVFISIIKSSDSDSDSAAAALLATLTPEQYYELAYRLASKANIERWKMVELLDKFR